MKTLIPKRNLEKLEKKVNRIKSKGAQVTFIIDDKAHFVADTNGYYHECYYVEISGVYKLGNWQFIGTLEHTPAGNIIRNITSEIVPDKFKTCRPECEHCHKTRERKDTYIVKNLETGEFKQVGRTCLQEYTGLDAENAAYYASCLGDAEAQSFDPEMMSLLSPDDKYTSANSFKNVAYYVVKKYGYIKNETKLRILEILPNAKNYNYADEIKAIDEWVSTLKENNDYIYNAKIAWKLDFIQPRHYTLIASLINTYFKDLQERAKNSETKYFGTISDRITIKVASVKVLYVKQAYHYYQEDTCVYRIIDDQGNIFIWDTSQNLENVDTITATIKDHREYKGEKQTVITRGKVTYKALQTYTNKDAIKDLNQVEDTGSIDDIDWDTFWDQQ